MNKALIHFILVFIIILVLDKNVSGQKLHIDTIGCRLTETDIVFLNSMAAYEGRFYNQMFETNNNDTATININLFGNYNLYRNALKQDKHSTFSDKGYYSPKQKKMYINKTPIYLHVILHEISHSLLRNNYPDPPRWLTEGIATMMGFTKESEGKIIYLPQYNYLNYAKDVAWKNTIDFDNVFLDHNSDWQSKRNSPQIYALSYAVIFFVINYNTDYLRQIVLLMKKGTSAQDAIANTFGSFDHFKEQFTGFYRYILKGGE